MDECYALQKQKTRSLIVALATINVVRCNWVKLKHNCDRSITRYKARLVDKGYHSIDYDETFSPLLKPAIVKKIIISLTISCG